MHQMQEYYVHGNVDDCTGHWSNLVNCLKKKTTRYKDDVPVDPNAGKHLIWQIRTPAEAQHFWSQEFYPPIDEHSVHQTAQKENDSGARKPSNERKHWINYAQKNNNDNNNISTDSTGHTDRIGSSNTSRKSHHTTTMI